MIDTKVLLATLEVPDVINYAADPERFCLTQLRERYVGRCFQAAFVVDILGIRRRPPCKVQKTNNRGGGSVEVEFEARVATFSAESILVGVRVVQREKGGLVIGTHEALPGGPGGAPVRLAAVVAPGGGAETARVAAVARVDQVLPARVIGKQDYKPMMRQISVLVLPLVCARSVAPAFRLEGKLGQPAAEELVPLADQIDAELQLRGELVAVAEKKELLLRFEEMFYSYVPGAGSPPPGPWIGPRMREPPPGVLRVDLLGLVRAGARGDEPGLDGIWSRSLDLYRSLPLVARSESPPADWPAPSFGDPRAVLSTFLSEALSWLVAIRQMVEVYGEGKMFDDHANIWETLAQAQLP